MIGLNWTQRLSARNRALRKPLRALPRLETLEDRQVLSYVFTSFDYPGFEGQTLGYSINRQGDVVGFTARNGNYHGFLYSGGTFSDIIPPNATGSQANGINDQGNIVGDYSSNSAHGYLDVGGSFTTFDPPGSVNTDAFDINNNGHIGGIYKTSDAAPYQGFLYSNGAFTTIDAPNMHVSQVYGLNDSDQLAVTCIDDSGHYHGFIYSSGNFTPLNIPGAVETAATDISNSGAIVAGARYSTGGGHAILLIGNSTVNLDYPNAQNTQLVHINELGQVVGYYQDAQGYHGFIATPVPPTIAIGDASVTEGDSGTTNMDFTVSLDYPSTNPVTIHYATAAGTAKAGADFVNKSGTITFNPGETSKTVSVAVKGDLLNEDNENFFVNLSGATNATIGDSQAVGTIIDNDPLPSVSVNDVSQAEGNSGTTNFNFTISLSAVSGRSVTVQYATANSTAEAPGDFSFKTGLVTFAAGQTSKTVTVSVKGDTTPESNETFFLNLITATNASISNGTGLGTILNDDGAHHANAIAQALRALPAAGNLEAAIPMPRIQNYEGDQSVGRPAEQPRARAADVAQRDLVFASHAHSSRPAWDLEAWWASRL